MVVRTKLPKGIIAVGIFLLFGNHGLSRRNDAAVRGTIFDRIWALNAQAYSRLAPFGKTVGVLFLLLSATLLFAGAGWFKRRRWGWRLAVAIIVTQVLGDLLNASTGDVIRGGISFIIAAALLVYLLRPQVRSAFTSANVSSPRRQIR